MSCSDKDSVRHSIPIINSIDLSQAESITVPDTLFFSANLSDPVTPLSTIEVDLFLDDQLIESSSIRTKGNSVQLENQGLAIPFLANITENSEVNIQFTLINVDGHEASDEKRLSVKRPDLPNTLFFVTNDEVLEFKNSEENIYLYSTDVGTYGNAYSGKLATHTDFVEAEFLWNGDGQNKAAIGDRFGDDIAIDFATWEVDKLSFDAISFMFDVEGEQTAIYVKDNLLTGLDGYFYTKLNFTKDEVFTIDGLEPEVLEQAYNRDFFSYDEATGDLTFLRDSGEWEIYYDKKINYLWVVRMDDVAPDAYWVVGHGFSSAPVWNVDLYFYGGWSTSDVNRMAYMVSIGDNKYQTSVYINNEHEWGNFEFQFYSDRSWGKDLGIELFENGISGDIAGIEVYPGDGGLVGKPDFVPGYYRLILDVSQGTSPGQPRMEILRIGD